MEMRIATLDGVGIPRLSNDFTCRDHRRLSLTNFHFMPLIAVLRGAYRQCHWCTHPLVRCTIEVSSDGGHVHMTVVTTDSTEWHDVP